MRLVYFIMRSVYFYHEVRDFIMRVFVLRRLIYFITKSVSVFSGRSVDYYFLSARQARMRSVRCMVVCII